MSVARPQTPLDAMHAAAVFCDELEVGRLEEMRGARASLSLSGRQLGSFFWG